MASSVPYIKIEDAFAVFAAPEHSIRGAAHITALHQHIAMRMVIEGGFLPDEVTPHPPLAFQKAKRGNLLIHDPASETRTELTVLGGLKTKDIDVVVTKPQVGPVLAISVKGTTKAFRNLTNRMEEAIGDSTNLHIMYPGLVYGFLQVIRVNRKGQVGLDTDNDISVDESSEATKSIQRYHEVLVGLTGRRLVRDDYTRYEAVGFAMVETLPGAAGQVFDGYPPKDSPLAPDKFFTTLLRIYDLRFPFVGAGMKGLKRVEWSAASPLFQQTPTDGNPIASVFGYLPRIG